MRNLKKVLALVVAVAMIASMGLAVSAASYSDVASNASYADAVNLLSNLGIIKGYEDGTFKPDNTVTRAEAATMIVRMLGLDDEVEAGETNFTDVAADNWASGYVNVAEANGIINGMGDGTFNPNGEVTYGQIVKMIVCALGYEPVALANGGYLGGGYLYAGSSQVTGFTKGVAGTANAAASRATVARLIYNALEVELMDQTAFSTGINGSTYEVLENKTILSEYLELEKVDGVIVETYLSSSVYDADAAKDVALVITKNYDEGKKDYPVSDEKQYFIAEGTDAATLLGYTVTAYVGENEDGDDAMFAVAAKSGKNSALVLDTNLVKSIDETEIVYYKSESAKSTTTAEIQAYVGKNADDGVAVDGYVVVNGFNDDYVNVGAILANIDSEEIEEVTLLDNDNDGDFEFIFVTVPGEGADEFVVAEVENEDDLWILYDEDEEARFEIDFEDEDMLYTIVKDGKIVDVSAIAEGDVVSVLDDVPVLTVYVSSVVVEGTVDEVDDDVYTINGGDYELSPLSFDDEDTLEAGDEGIFYINAMGKIAYVDTVSTIDNADYVYIVDADVKDGDFGAAEYIVKVVTATGAVEVLTIKSKKVDVYSEAGEDLDVTDDKAYEAVEEYVGIARLDVTAAGEISAIYLPGAEDFDVVDTYADDAEDEYKSYNEARGTYGVVDLAAGTLVFNIDDDEDEDLEDRITVSTVGKFFVDETSYSFIAYGEADEVAEALVVTAGNAAVDAEAPVMVVTKVSKVVVDDEDTIKITGVVAGAKVSVIVDPDETVAVEKGNVILYAEAGEFVEDVQVLFDSDDEATGDINASGDIVASASDEAVSIHFGEITEKKAKYVVVGGDKFYFADSVNVIVVDYTGANVSIAAGSLSDVKTSSKYLKEAFVKTALESEDEITDIVVFTSDDDGVDEDEEVEVPSEEESEAPSDEVVEDPSEEVTE